MHRSRPGSAPVLGQEGLSQRSPGGRCALVEKEESDSLLPKKLRFLGAPKCPSWHRLGRSQPQPSAGKQPPDLQDLQISLLKFNKSRRMHWEAEGGP